MAADAIELYVDLSTPQGKLVTGLSDKTPFALGPFYQGQLLKLRIYPVVPSGNRTTAPFYSKVALDTLDVQVAIGPAAGTEAIKAAQYTWTKQTTNDAEGKSGYFYADLDLNTTDLNNAVGTSDTYSTFFEILLSRASGTFRAVFNTGIVINAVVKGPASAASIPTPAASYLTRDECLALFVAWNNALFAANNGRMILLTSPDGSRTREIGIANDGAPIENLS